MEKKNKEKINSNQNIYVCNFNNLVKEEWLSKTYDSYTINSINNGINPIINLLIDSIDRFSFGELIDEEKQSNIIKKNGPDNYLIISHKQNNEQEKNIINNIDEIIDYNNIKKLEKEKLDNNKNKEKICGVFTKEDFDVNIKHNHKNQINDSFQKKYNNPLVNDSLTNSKEKNNIENPIKNKDDNFKEDKNLIKYQELINSKTDKEINLNNVSESLIDNEHVDNKKDYDTIIKYDSPKIKSEDVYCRDNNINEDSLKDKNIDKIVNLPFSLNNEEKNPPSITSFNKLMEVDVKEKLIELSEKVKTTEKKFEKIEKKNQKLLDILNVFKNFKFFDKIQNSKSRENTIQNSSKKIPIKKRCFSPSLNNSNLNKKSNNKEKNNTKEKIISKPKENKSFNKMNVFIDINNSLFNDNNYLDYNKIKEYCLSKRSTYKEIYSKDKSYKKNLRKNKLYKKVNTKNNKTPIIRKTLFLTGSDNKYSNKFNNYSNSNKNIYFSRDNDKMFNGNYLCINNYSYPSTRKNQNNSDIIINNGIGNIYQREIMKLPPEQQPLFYESNNNLFKNHFLYDNNINNNCNDTISFKEPKINFDEKYNYKQKIFSEFIKGNLNGISNLNENKNNSFNNNIDYYESKSNRYNKNKFLNFKDFQIIFEEKNKELSNDLVNKKYNNQIPSLKGKINNNTKINSEYNYIKENGNIIKENGNPKEYNNYANNKYSDFINKKYRNLFGKQAKSNINNINDNEKQMNNNSINNKNKNEFTLPFYLINRQELYMNILNSSNNNKKYIKPNKQSKY